MKREARVSLPLAAFHNVGTIPRLRKSNTHAVLEVGWIDHPEAHLERRAYAENTFVETASHWAAQRWLRGERLPLPNVN